MRAINELRASAETMMQSFSPADLPPKGKLYYHQGVFLVGLVHLWQLSGEKKYFDYVKAYLDSVLDEDGHTRIAQPGELDDVMAGNLLFPVYDETGDERYRQAMHALYQHLCAIPRTSEGAPWHKTKLPYQMWLDGIYMADPFLAAYAQRFGETDALELAKTHIRVMLRHTYDPATGLYRHAWDETKCADWADPVTGQSPELWGRSVGWLPVGLLNTYDCIPENDAFRDELAGYVRTLMAAVRSYQSPEGRWYQVLDKGDQAGNWLENSCSCLFAAALYKGLRLNILDTSFLASVEKAFGAVLATIGRENGQIQVGQVCIGTDVGDYAHYIARPVSVNDLHAVGAYQLMCAEKERFDRMHEQIQ